MTTGAKILGLGAAGAGGAAAAKGFTLAKALQIGGTALSAGGAIAGGVAGKASAGFQAEQLEARGKSELASSTYRAAEEDRQKRLVVSRARAVGASGGGRDFDLEGRIEEEGTYRQLMALWEGEDAMSGLNTQAEAARFGGRQAKRAGGIAAAGIAASGAYTLYENHWKSDLQSLRSKYGRRPQ